ncbi:RNA-binding protein 25 [Drosophila guanche]|uniref:Uncharacterized protein n=1 Tax=Drosophila guanche TaxID=7266 RepID=A0A3B0KDQ0_DROGU|nr:RNA-binding protein 25 [Drosophila guanche]SPP86410.1 Hypothetical predicted protein [Drosophila guanche]
MGVIYKILKQQRQHQRQQQRQGFTMDLRLSTATKCKMQAAIKQRQQQRRLEDHLETGPEPGRSQERDHNKEALAAHQLQQLCCFLSENTARKQCQSLKLQYDSELPAERDDDREQERELEREREREHVNLSPPGHVMEMDLIEKLHHDHLPYTAARKTVSTAPRDSILMKIRHQIFERKRQQQRQLAELVQQRLVVWRPW